MEWDFRMVVLIVEWSSFQGGLRAGFYCIQYIHVIYPGKSNVCEDSVFEYEYKPYIINAPFSNHEFIKHNK